ncbi:hypothetical protein EMO37_12210 [Escherichia coli]|nr:hypothetical protein [Escherichia coli]
MLRGLAVIFARQKTEKLFRHKTRGLEGVARFTSPHALRHAVCAVCAYSARMARRTINQVADMKTHGWDRALRDGAFMWLLCLVFRR